MKNTKAKMSVLVAASALLATNASPSSAQCLSLEGRVKILANYLIARHNVQKEHSQLLAEIVIVEYPRIIARDRRGEQPHPMYRKGIDDNQPFRLTKEEVVDAVEATNDFHCLD